MSQSESLSATPTSGASNTAHESGIHLAAPRTAAERASDAASLEELARATAFDLDAEDDDTPIVIEEIEAFDPEWEACDEASSPSTTARTPFTEYLEAVSRAARAEGGDGAALERFLDTLEVSSVPDDAARQALREGKILAADGDGVTETFRRAHAGWRAIIDGTSDDFTACGGTMLDEWTAELCARWLGSPEISPRVRRALRDRGVAAFGLTLVA